MKEAVINALDLELVLMREGWVRGDYPQWNVDTITANNFKDDPFKRVVFFAEELIGL